MSPAAITPADLRAKLALHELSKEGLEQLAEVLVAEWENSENELRRVLAAVGTIHGICAAAKIPFYK